MTVSELKRALEWIPQDLPVVMDIAFLQEGHDEPGWNRVDLDGYADLLGIGPEDIERDGRKVDVVMLGFGIDEPGSPTEPEPHSSETHP